MARGPVFVPSKMFRDLQARAGSVPVAKIFLPQFSAAVPIRVTHGNGNRRIAEARRRPT
jgi:hypothetical protein